MLLMTDVRVLRKGRTVRRVHSMEQSAVWSSLNKFEQRLKASSFQTVKTEHHPVPVVLFLTSGAV